MVATIGIPALHIFYSTVTPWIPESMGVMYSNEDQWITDSLDHKQVFSVGFLDHLLNSGPFENQTQIYHLNIGLVR